MERLSNNKPVPFSLIAVSSNRRKPKLTGRVLIIENAILAKHIKYLEGGDAYSLNQVREFTPQSRKDIPNKRFRNSVRKIAILGSEGTYVFRNIHTRLILQFNGFKVIP